MSVPKMNYWVLALAAVKGSMLDGGRVNVDMGLSQNTCHAMSQEDAKRQGEQLALDKWPESEGWAQHLVIASLISRAELAFAYESATLDQIAPNENESEQAPGLLM